MESKEKKLAELAVGLRKNANIRNIKTQFKLFCRKVDEVEKDKPLSENPFIDEVCSGRLLSLIYRYFEVYVPGYGGEPERLHAIQVSDLPELEQIKSLKRGFGYKSQQEYSDLLKKYRNN